jgi:hypothetical protein
MWIGGNPPGGSQLSDPSLDDPPLGKPPSNFPHGYGYEVAFLGYWIGTLWKFVSAKTTLPYN